ncbi:hypothetical protein G7Y89_g8685 [Cudoniella acicularis]|uniref:Betaine lipid synthase n=1 Tax=Cudoniella acicularis TaxID=354080 RepID=A0A8H4RG60_9HELO|nr:hypothetical protein G7Y89_g8685 [Cudoniella acicularis]
MASLIPSVLPRDPHNQIFLAGGTIVLLVGVIFALTLRPSKHDEENPSAFASFLRFFYASFLKPHTGDAGNGQQDALESFYKAQAGVYDVTRKTLLRGREDMLGLVAAQLVNKAAKERTHDTKRIWVDIGGGTGWNIEAMSEFVSVPDFFSSVYLVDFSPSLCEVARKRFTRLGWKNVKVVCQDARTFRLEDHEGDIQGAVGRPRSPTASYFAEQNDTVGGADLITLSYSLSMIPDFYSVIDSLTKLLSPSGTIGVVDFYVQSIVDLSFRNYTGGALNRHVHWFGRLFWRAWFDVDRVGLEAGRRDYLEYRFGTVLSADSRNYLLGSIPYYVWLGCPKKPESAIHTPSHPNEIVERLDAAVTESPYLSPIYHSQSLSRSVERSTFSELRSKAFDAAIINLSANLPLPSFFYQNHHWRIYYDDQLKKHTQFKKEYIYAFTWEDTRVDHRLLKLNSDDVVLAITSAGDNILSYALSSPAKIHAVDLNPNQNHLLELKVAAFTALPYADFWKMFGEGKHPNFRSLLISRLSPHMSSRAYQFWLNHAHVFTSSGGRGLYETGGSRHAIRIIRLLATGLGFRSQIKSLIEAKTLNEQREIWVKKIRPLIMSRLLSYFVVSSEKFLWAALGVPHNQLAMLEADHLASESVSTPASSSPLGHTEKELSSNRGAAVWEYMVQTLDPVIESSLIGEDNPYYLVCLQGCYSQRCHPDYLKPKSHQKLSRAGAFDGLRIHTDEINEVVNRLAPGTLTVAVVMDSMDWFDPGAEEAARQISKLNRALKLGGRVMLRSAALTPWYIATFESLGFQAKRVGARIGGACIDRVNMYASCWVITKIENIVPRTPSRENSVDFEKLEI